MDKKPCNDCGKTHSFFDCNKLPMDNTQLPAEMAEAINQFVEDKTKAEREHWNKAASDPDRTSTYIAGYEHGVRKGATEYASKLHLAEEENKKLIRVLLENEQAKRDELQKEIESLKRWKAEASEILNPILDYGQSKEADIRLGGSISDIIIERCKQAATARTLLQKFISRHEAGLLPDRFIYEEIKTFLDGK